MDTTTVRLKVVTHDKIKELSKKGETYEDCIARLIIAYEDDMNDER